MGLELKDTSKPSVEDLQARLAAANEALEPLEADDEYDAFVARVEDAERRAAAVPAIRRARAELGQQDVKFKIIETTAGTIIVKRANPLLYRQFVDAGKYTTTAYSRLVMPTIYHPSKEEAERIFEELPHALVRCADAVAELAGVRVKELGPKS